MTYALRGRGSPFCVDVWAPPAIRLDCFITIVVMVANIIIKAILAACGYPDTDGC